MDRRKIIVVLLFSFLTTVVILCLPREIVRSINAKKIVNSVNKLPKSDIVIVFGTIVDNKGTISPLLKERLTAGIMIKKSTKSEKIVVSNTKKAAEVMKEYVLEQGIASDSIEVDPQANTTLDTCRYEKEKHPEKRKVIFVSQSFHIPRLLFQCQKEGIEGVAFPAEILTKENSKENWMTKIFIRTGRYLRESWLTWLVLLKIYN